MATGIKAEQLLEQWRDYALSLPDTQLGSRPWGATVVKVGGKTFVSMGLDGASAAICCKLDASRDAALKLPFAEPNHRGGASGWTTAHIDGNARVPPRLIQSWIEESYYLMAPKPKRATSPSAERPSRRRRPRTKAAK